ncbi:pyridoxal phosphate-dependent aminotransferase [Streptomyces sp. NPDC005480]|uniref:pyridoxal phosphate-dependent aminotransferase n=1 Tax=Streptomyces sp. NPDC005480 TaxID=3154880 RepID=UPI0033A561F7
MGYTETYGDSTLREVIAQTYERADAADVICFAGAEEALYLAMNVLLGAGDHAVVVTPNYQAAETVPLALCEVTGVALDAGRDWALDLDQVKAAIRPNTRVVSVNFPNNPTGKVISAADFTKLARLCDERGIHLFSDEVYRGLERDRASRLPQAADLSERSAANSATPPTLWTPCSDTCWARISRLWWPGPSTPMNRSRSPGRWRLQRCRPGFGRGRTRNGVLRIAHGDDLFGEGDLYARSVAGRATGQYEDHDRGQFRALGAAELVHARSGEGRPATAEDVPHIARQEFGLLLGISQARTALRERRTRRG